MDYNSAKTLIEDTFNFPFDEGRFRYFVINLLNNIDEGKAIKFRGYIKNAFKPHVGAYRRLGTYTDPEGEKVDVLVVQLKNEWALERSRTMLRNFTADYLKTRDEKDAALVVYYTTNPEDWRFSFIRMEYKLEETDSGKLKVKEDVTPAKRYSFLVGKNEPNHTAQSQLVSILEDDENNPTLFALETAFSVDAVTKQFYKDYRAQFEKLWNELSDIVANDPKIAAEFETKTIDTANFAKKLMGQIVFLYFLQKKGWLGVGKDENGNFKDWGTGPKNFLRRLFDKEFTNYDNFFNEVLEPLFYEGLASEHDDDYFSVLDCKVPFLNGGLFEPMNGYNWKETDIRIDNDLIGEVFKTFDRYNFTVREDEPLEKEVAVDPEMLGKVFENLLPENLRKGKGAYYTPRTIVHYMCQESLINYLDTECASTILVEDVHKQDACGTIPKADIETLVREGDIILELETAIKEGTKSYKTVLKDSIKDNAQALDDALANIKVCDPAIGSGAFPVGMLTEIVKARTILSLYLNNFPLKRGVPKERGVYELKRHCIQNSLYGVDIDPGAIEIAKLRLWLSLVVDEDDYNTIQPLPNLDYKIMQGNSLIEEFHGISLDIEKKDEQIDVFSGGSALDVLINDLHKKQNDFFNAEHPREKKKKRQEVEYAIYNIFHSELGKNTGLAEPEKKKIETNLKEMTHGNKERNFFPWKLYFADVFREKGGFDVVIANPPYIGERKHKEVFTPIQNGNMSKYYFGRMDYFYFFFHLALDELNRYGSAIFITTNYYPTALGAKKLRDDLKNRSDIVSLINFNELKIFDSASGQHNMVTFFRKRLSTNSVNAFTCVSNVQGIVKENILQEILDGKNIDTEYFNISQEDLWEGTECYLRITGSINSDNPTQNILSKVWNNNSSIELGNLCNTIIGLESSADKVYILNKSDIKNIIHNENENLLFKDFYKNSDINRYIAESKTGKVIIYVHEEINSIKSMPGIWEYLKANKSILASRKGANLRGAFKRGHWWVLNTPRLKLDFEGEKLVTPYRSKTNRFAYTKIPWYASRDVYYITKKSDDIDLKYILSLLNSKIYYLWLYHKGKRKGEMLELYSKPLSEIPIKKIGLDEQKPFINLVDQILSAKKANPQADTTALEAEIDQLVYELYGLTEEEIRIVEKSVK